MIAPALLAAASAAALLAAPAPAAGGEGFAVRAAQLERGDGQRVRNGILWVEGGRIRAAGAEVDLPEGLPVVEHGGVVTAGLVACHSYEGLAGDLHEPTRSVLDGARMADAFAPGHGDFERALEAGITTVVLAPAPVNLVGGRAVVVKTAGGAVALSDAHLVLGLGEAALVQDRYPTSAPGALAELEQRLEHPSGAFAEARQGERAVLLAIGSSDDLARALRLAERYGLRGALVGVPRPLEGQAKAIRQAGLGVVLGPFGPGADPARLQTAVELGREGVPLAFALDDPFAHPDALRLCAAQCVRAGLAPELARAALTADAARLAGVADRVGRLERGLDADFVLWSGDPLDLTSSVEAVYVGGRLAYERPR
jgi:imidazolonepropionase-like amidohydrolase